jgi:mannose-6-phosphate isomerase-like protein (cupin superfamily)
MFDLMEKAKQDGKVLTVEKYHTPEITWEDVAKFLYSESLIPNEILKDRILNQGGAFRGNVEIQSGLWFAPQGRKSIFSHFKGVTELLYKLNKSIDNTNCDYYEGKHCNCSSDWHLQGIRISMTDRVTGYHQDTVDAIFWQILGTSLWEVDQKETYELKPGDLVYLPTETAHKVWGVGPRLGLIIDNLNTTYLK